MSKKYAYIYSLYKDDGYWTGFASIEDALAAARKRKPMEVRQYPMRIFRFEEGQDDTG